jgi:hypothetical protein
MSGGTMAPRACLCQQANCTLIARTGLRMAVDRMAPPMLSAVSCGYVVERVTGIEPALSAWEADVLPLNYTRTVPSPL